MVAKIKKSKLMLVADVQAAPELTETFEAPWGKVWSHGADVMTTWKNVVIDKKTGKKWVPPSEYRNDYLFKINRDAGFKND